MAGFAQAEVDDLDFANRRVIDVLAEYDAAGFELLYSSSLVRRSLRFSSNPAPAEPMRRLAAALRQVGLGLETSGDLSRVVRLSEDTRLQDSSLQGRVVDSVTNLPVAGVKVIVGHMTATTDELGRFDLAPGPTDAVTVSRPGYRSKILTPDAEVASLLEIALDPIRELEEVVVVSSRYAVQNTRSNPASVV